MFSILKYTQELFRRRRKSCRYRCELFLITVTSLILLSAVGAKFYPLLASFSNSIYFLPEKRCFAHIITLSSQYKLFFIPLSAFLVIS